MQHDVGNAKNAVILPGLPVPVVRALEVHTAVGRGRSRPVIARADDGFDYVIKLRSIPKTTRRLIAELIAGQIAGALGIPQPPMALVLIESDLAVLDMHPEKTEEIRESVGLVFGSRVVDEVTTLRRTGDCPIPPDAAARIVWFDSLVLNADRKWRNPNILVNDDEYWVIDNDSAFNPHHKWAEPRLWKDYGYSPVSGLQWWPKADHVLLPWASSISVAGDSLAPLVSDEVIKAAVGCVPEAWLVQGFPDGCVIEPRLMYESTLKWRLHTRKDFEHLADVARYEGTCFERV